jgi:hypothetical protein
MDVLLGRAYLPAVDRGPDIPDGGRLLYPAAAGSPHTAG